ncbi:MAG: proline racemase family protein [Pseudomonadota bacterium]|nr:proline racemase family protein [Pseudomonadota bacterium]
MKPESQRVQVVDSHTGGEPTRIVVSGGPDLGSGDMASRRKIFNDQFNDFRSAVVNEPRGSDVWVGGILCKPTRPESVTGIVFFNNVGVLNMCGHGTIGLAVTLAHLGRIGPGNHLIETPVGEVRVALHEDFRVTVTNVPSYRFRSGIELDLDEDGTVVGDIAWGGNWFFLVGDHNEDVKFENIDRLTRIAQKIRGALERRSITGEAGQQIDHVELFGPASYGADSRNFVLCPGGAYDRSPCGTGTSAKLACLMAEGKIKAGETWRQESIVGSVFEAQGHWQGDTVIPKITGSAHVNAESTLILDPSDPFCMGIG